MAPELTVRARSLEDLTRTRLTLATEHRLDVLTSESVKHRERHEVDQSSAQDRHQQHPTFEHETDGNHGQ